MMRVIESNTSKLDAIKARIAFHEKVFFAAMATVLALVGWTVSNYISANTWVLGAAAFATISLSAYAIRHYKRLKKPIMEIEHVE